jgi:hypothetical protein
MVGIFIIMKIIITESQHKKLQMRQWLLRRYDLVKSAFNDAIDEVNPCRWPTFDLYETFFYSVFMDGLHPEYYLIDDFDYNGIKSVLMELFYVELTEHYYDKRQRC